MPEVELVIKMSEEMYKWVNDENKFFDDYGVGDFVNLVRNGTLIPEGHRRIGDLDAVMSDISTSINEMTNMGVAVDGNYLWAKLNDAIDNASTLIKADKQEKAEVTELDKPHIKGDYYDGFKNGLRTAEWRYNKIRAEIEGKIVKRPWLDFEDRERDRNDAFLEALDIIDKYKAENSEMTE